MEVVAALNVIASSRIRHDEAASTHGSTEHSIARQCSNRKVEEQRRGSPG